MNPSVTVALILVAWLSPVMIGWLIYPYVCKIGKEDYFWDVTAQILLAWPVMVACLPLLALLEYWSQARRRNARKLKESMQNRARAKTGKAPKGAMSVDFSYEGKVSIVEEGRTSFPPHP